MKSCFRQFEVSSLWGSSCFSATVSGSRTAMKIRVDSNRVDIESAMPKVEFEWNNEVNKGTGLKLLECVLKLYNP